MMVSHETKLEWIDDNHVNIIGPITETSDFHSLEYPKKNISEIFINFKNMTRMNSNGVKKWLQSLEKFPYNKIHYTNCSTALVEQMSIVSEFLKPKIIVDSFEARYVCQNCNEVHLVDFVIGKDIQPGQEEYLDEPEKKCPKCGELMEFDHNPDSYFYFLTKLIP